MIGFRPWLGLWCVLVALLFLWFRGSTDDFDVESIRFRRVVITDASAGMGEQLAYRFAALGASLALTGRNARRLREVARKCEGLGARQAEVIAADVSTPDGRSLVVERAVSLLGGLDHLVLTQQRRPKTLDDPQNASAHLVAFADLGSRALPALNSSGGSVIVVASVVSRFGLVGFGCQSAVQFALRGFFSSWRRELPLRHVNVTVSLAVVADVDEYAFHDWTRALLSWSLTDLARAVVASFTRRDADVFVPGWIRYVVALHDFFPNVVDDMVSRLMKDDAVTSFAVI